MLIWDHLERALELRKARLAYLQSFVEGPTPGEGLM